MDRAKQIADATADNRRVSADGGVDDGDVGDVGILPGTALVLNAAAACRRAIFRLIGINGRVFYPQGAGIEDAAASYAFLIGIGDIAADNRVADYQSASRGIIDTPAIAVFCVVVCFLCGVVGNGDIVECQCSTCEIDAAADAVANIAVFDGQV